MLAAAKTSPDTDFINSVVDAIYLAEGGDKTNHPYGVISVKVKNKEEARRVCYNSVVHRLNDWRSEGSNGDFIVYLGSFYCPPSAHNLNKYWVKNVKFFLNKKD